MITVNGWCAGGLYGVGKWGDECSVSWGMMSSVQTFSYLSWKHWQKELQRREPGVPCRGVFLGRVEWEGGKTSSDQYPKGPRIPWRRNRGQLEVVAAARNEGPSPAVSLHRGGGGCQETNLGANLWIRFTHRSGLLTYLTLQQYDTSWIGITGIRYNNSNFNNLITCWRHCRFVRIFRGSPGIGLYFLTSDV